MLKAVGKQAFRIRNPQSALATLREAVRLAQTPPCGPVSLEIPIDVQAMMLPLPDDLTPLAIVPAAPQPQAIARLAAHLQGKRRPLLWLGGGAGAAVRRLVDQGWAVVSSVQGRGILPEDHPASLGSYNLQKSTEAFYGSVDAMLVVGSRLRSNETLSYKLNLPVHRYRIDVDPLAQDRAYSSEVFVQGDAQLSLDALADALEGRMQIDPAYATDVRQARQAAEAIVDGTIGPYVSLKNGLQRVAGASISWVRDITLSNTMWGNRAPMLDHPRAGVHALGGGIGQGLAMGIGAAVANRQHALGRKTVVLAGDGGFMLNLGELACAVQEQAQLVVLLMNDRRYGVIRNIQDAVYGGRHCYVDLHTPDFSTLCASLQAGYLRLDQPDRTEAVLAQALGMPGPVVVEVDMAAWGDFPVKFAGPPKKTH
jgi:acetolactate synthase-1/2/3 large subunit